MQGVPMPTSAFNDHQLFYFWAVFSNRMGVMPHMWGKTPILHLCKILHFIPPRETLRSIGGAFRKKLVGQNGSLAGCSDKRRQKKKIRTQCRNIYKCDSSFLQSWEPDILWIWQKLVWQNSKSVGQPPHHLYMKLHPCYKVVMRYAWKRHWMDYSTMPSNCRREQ